MILIYFQSSVLRTDQATQTESSSAIRFSPTYVTAWKDLFTDFVENLDQTESKDEIWDMGMKALNFFDRTKHMVISIEDENRIKELATKTAKDKCSGELIYKKNLNELVKLIEKIERKNSEFASFRFNETSF